MKIYKSLRKRGLALFLALVMCLSMLPATALAADSDSETFPKSATVSGSGITIAPGNSTSQWTYSTVGSNGNLTNNGGTISKQVGETGFYLRCPTNSISGMYCGHVVAEYIPDCYTDITTTSSQRGIINNTSYAVGQWPNKGPCLKFNFTAAKPGRTTIAQTYYVNFMVSAESGYCGICGRLTTIPRDYTWHKYKDTFGVTVNADYVLEYNSNGGNAVPKTLKSVPKTSETLTVTTAKPTRAGYTFLGWADTADATTAQYQAGAQITLNWSEGFGSKANPVKKTLFAVWEKDEDTAPNAPTRDDLYGILRVFVNVKCVSTGEGLPHDEKTYSTWNGTVDGKYESEIGAVYKGTDGKWKCDVTLNGAVYAKMYSTEPSFGTGVSHSLAPKEDATKKFTLTYDTSTEKWTSGKDKGTILATFEVVCKYYTVKYNDGNAKGTAFAEQTYSKLAKDTATPAFNSGKDYNATVDKVGNPVREGYTFKGWEPTVAATVTQDVTYVARWEKLPEAPDKPTPDNVNEELKGDRKGAVVVHCQPNRHEQAYFNASAAGRIQIGEVQGNATSGYTCVVTFLAQKYCEAYNTLKKTTDPESDEFHTLVSGEGNKTVTFQWNTDTEKWVLPEGTTGPVEFYVKCKDSTPPTEQTAKIRVIKQVTSTNKSYNDGDTVSYQVDVTNTGDVTLYDLVIDDTMDPALTMIEPENVTATMKGANVGLTYLSTDKNEQGKTVTKWAATGLEKFEVGETLTLTYSATVSHDSTDDTTMNNVAHAKAWTEPETSNPSPAALWMPLTARTMHLPTVIDSRGFASGSSSVTVEPGTRKPVEDSSDQVVEGDSKPGTEITVNGKIEYTVDWYDQAGKSIKLRETRKDKAGENVAATDADKVVDGYTFKADDTRNVLSGTLSKEGAKVELKLYFTKDEETPDQITVTWLDGYTTTPIKVETIDRGGDYSELYPNDPTRDGYKFTGWGEPVTDKDGNITITAQWKENPLIIPDNGIDVTKTLNTPDNVNVGDTIQWTIEVTNNSGRERTLYVTDLLNGLELNTTYVGTESPATVMPATLEEAPAPEATGPVEDEAPVEGEEPGEEETPAEEQPPVESTEPAGEEETPVEEPAPVEPEVPAGEPASEDEGVVELADALYAGEHFTLVNGAKATFIVTYTAQRSDAGRDLVNRVLVYDVDVTDPIREAVADPVHVNDLPRHTLTVHYVYEDGTEARPDYTGTYAEGDGYSVTSPAIPGYTVDVDVVRGTMGASDMEVWVTYTPIAPEQYTLTIYYVYADGSTAAPTVSETHDAGYVYTVASPVLPGYTASEDVVSGVLNSDREYTVVYTLVPPTPGPVDPVTPVTPNPGTPSIPDAPAPLGPTPGTNIGDEDVPLAGAIGLNDVDHFAYIIGYEDDTVRPLNNITRAEVATIFFRLMTEAYRTANWATENDFGDVAKGNWFNNAVSTSANAGLVKGYADGSFKPNQAITRAEFAVIASRFLSDEVTGENAGDFADTANHWAAKEIRRAAEAGWITGSNNQFRPNDNITRAEVMTIVNRMLDRLPDADHMLENMKKWIDNPEDAWYYEAVQEATNEHAYERDELGAVESWTELLTIRDWKALELEWAANGGASAAAPETETADEAETEAETEPQEGDAKDDAAAEGSED